MWTLGVAEPGEDGCAELVGLGAGVAAAPLVLHRHLQRRPPPEHEPDALTKSRPRLGGERAAAAAAVGGGHGVARVWAFGRGRRLGFWPGRRRVRRRGRRSRGPRVGAGFGRGGRIGGGGWWKRGRGCRRRRGVGLVL
uniref:Uncharacterized protein n=1 Tax=Arundo donax TaxID=35708 RepID=A0A0A9E9Q9_ARUDO